MNQAIASMDNLSVKDRGDVITKVFNKPAFSKIRVFAHRSTNTHTCTLAEKFSRGVLSEEPKILIFPFPTTVPSKLSSPIFDKVPHDAKIRLIVWPRGRRDCSMARG